MSNKKEHENPALWKKNYLGNESFTIFLTELIFLNETFISAIKFLTRFLKPQGYIALW